MVKNTLRWLACIILVLIPMSLVSAQSTPPELPSQGDTAALAAYLDALVPTLMESNAIPGASIAVIQSGAVAWANGYGLADVTAATPLTLDTPVNAWSISKALTATAILRLVEAGQLDLDAPITSYLTRWTFPSTRQPVDQVTARRILTHTAALSMEGYHAFAPGDSIPSLVEVLEGAGDYNPVSLMLRPGQTFIYSGGGFTVLQLVIEEITGEAFADHMQRTVFEPLGMTHSSFAYDPALGIATPYLRGTVADPQVVHVAQAAGGLATSAQDLATFFAALMQGDLISAESLALMFTSDEVAEEYGFGVFTQPAGDGPLMVWHDGVSPSAMSLFVLFPEQEEGIVILTNSREGRKLFADTLCAFESWAVTDSPALCNWGA